jgi:hypothetical protein
VILIVDARRLGQDEIPCHLHAMMALNQAKRDGQDWIRVDKPGHACDFMVAALREQMNANPQAVPRCLVTASPLERRDLGEWSEPHTRNWLGANLIAPFGR